MNYFFKQTILLCFLSIFTLCGCKRLDKEFIQLDVDNALSNDAGYDLSSIASTLEYMQLETSDDCLIDESSICNICPIGSNLLVADSKGCYLFDEKGEFVKRIGQAGRGPGEYNGINYALYDEHTESIYISPQRGNGILEFDINGNFQKTILPGYRVNDWAIDGQDILINVSNYYGNNPNMLLFMTLEGDTAHVVLNHDIFDFHNNMALNLNDDAQFYKFGGKTYYHRTFNDTVYMVKSGRVLEPMYVFKSASHKMEGELRSDAGKFVETTFDYIIPWVIIETNKTLFISMFRNGKGLVPFVYDKDSGIFSCLESNGYNNDIDDCLPFFPDYKFGEDRLCAVLPAYKVAEFDNDYKGKLPPGIITDLTEYSNPVLAIVTIK